MPYRVRIRNKDSVYVAVFRSDSKPTPKLEEIINCPQFTGISRARVTDIFKAVKLLPDGRAVDLVDAIEV